MEDTAKGLAAGVRISNYEIIGLAGAGGMGLVYKALDTKLNRVVALKFLATHLTFSQKDRNRLLQEARSASALDHPNIGVIHGIEETTDGQTFIVMAFYEGKTLAERIAAGPLPVTETIAISNQVAQGLSEAHQHNIIHRDVKPSNIVITRQNTVKIVDFGLALVLSDLASTRSLGIPGTAVYMSPEQIQRLPADRRSDIWALGVVLAEMLLGHHPFLRDNFGTTMYAILNDPPDCMDGIPRELQAITYKALAKDPAKRYQSCPELLADLGKLSSQAQAAAPDRSDTLLSTESLAAKDFEKYVQNASASTDKTARWSSETRRVLLSCFAVLAILAGLWFSAVGPWVHNHLAGAQRHIAVLPFANTGTNPLNPAIAEGLTDSLTNKLLDLGRGQESLQVIPASAVRESNIAEPAAALRALGATLVVKGSVARDGQNVRMSMDVIDTQTLRQVGSVQVDDPSEDIAALQDQAVRQLARIMHVNADPSSPDRPAPAAYEAYLTALSYIQRYDKSANLDFAISELQSAVSHDPQFALGYAELGEAYRLKYQLDHDRKWIDEVLSNCKTALALDKNLSGVYVTLGRIHNDSGNHDLAVEEFRHALNLDPRSADALNGMAYAYESAGRIPEAEATFKKAVALRPDYWDSYNTLGLFYNRQRRFNDAIAQLQHAVELTPDNAAAYYNLASAYLDSGLSQNLTLAEKALKKSIELGPTYPALANLGRLYLQEKRYAESAEMTRKALQLNDRNYIVWENLECAYQWLGEKGEASTAREKARELLEQAAKSSPRDAQVQSHLACQYGGEGRRDKALTRVDAALALAPNDPDVLSSVGDTYEELGDRAQAIKYAQLSLQKGYSLDDLRGDPDMRAVLADPNFRPKQK